MSPDSVAAAFDRISPRYDATREPLDAGCLERLAGQLRIWGIQRVLEVGVGTGRVSGPLAARGLHVTGVDASRGMLSRARSKGLARLAQGSAYRLPLADRTFDAVLFVHVLHLLERPRAALREACRVGREGAVGLVDPGGEKDSRHLADGLEPRQMVYDRLRAQGFELPRRPLGPKVRERRLLLEMPPDRIAPIEDREVTEPVATGLALFEHGASRWTLDVPADRLRAAVEGVRAEIGARLRTYRRRLALAMWTGPPPGEEPVAPHRDVRSSSGA